MKGGELRDNLQTVFKTKVFSETIYVDIFKIFKNSGEKFSNNSNGVFIDLNGCKEKTLREVLKYIDNIEKIHLEHEAYIKSTESRLDILKKSLVDDKKTISKEKPQKRMRKILNPVSVKVLDKELIPEKIVYNGVYKRLYNCIKGYKNKQIVKKEDKIQKNTEGDDLEDVEDVDDVDEVEVFCEAEVEAVVETEVAEDINDELFGSDSDEDTN